MIGVLIAVLFAALVWAICVALGLPAIVGIVAAPLPPARRDGCGPAPLDRYRV
jgi:hypothetical protein